MHVLVIEDKEMHRESARQTLSGHEVTIVATFDEAIALMEKEIDEKNVQRLLKEAGFLAFPAATTTKEGWKAYYKAREEAEAQSKAPFPFEVVLTDMMMPMSSKTLAPGIFKPSEQVPYGFVLALRATRRGAKFVAMVTDTNHHQGAMSAAIDHLSSAYWRDESRSIFMIDGARVLFVHAPFYREVLGKKACERCNGSGSCWLCKGTGKRDSAPSCNGCHQNVGKCPECDGAMQVDDVRQDRKDWGKVLAALIT